MRARESTSYGFINRAVDAYFRKTCILGLLLFDMSDDDESLRRNAELSDGTEWNPMSAFRFKNLQEDDDKPKRPKGGERIATAIASAVDDSDSILSARAIYDTKKRNILGSRSSDSDSDFRGSSADGSDARPRPRPPASRKRTRLFAPISPRSDKRHRPLERKAKSPSRLRDELKRSGLADSDAEAKSPEPTPAQSESPPNALPFSSPAGILGEDKPTRTGSEVDWDEIEQAELEKNPGWCALCKITQRAIDVGENNPYLAQLRKHAEDNWAKLPANEMGAQLQEIWNRDLRHYCDPPSLRLACHKQMFWKHFAFHDRSTRIQMEVDGLRYQILCDRMFADEEREAGLSNNPKKLNSWLKLQVMKERHSDKLSKLRPNNVL